MRKASLALFLLFVSQPSLAMNAADFRRSDDIIDLRLDEKSSSYRRAVVKFSEASSEIGFLADLLEEDKECAAAPKLLSPFMALHRELLEKNPVRELPSEDELNFNPSGSAHTADFLTEKAVDGLRTLREIYEPLTEKARALDKLIGETPFRDCVVNRKEKKYANAAGLKKQKLARRHSRTDGSEYKEGLREGLAGFLDAYIDLERELLKKQSGRGPKK